MLDTISQLTIVFTGATAVGLSQTNSAKLRKFAPIFGLMGQPAWFYATFTAEQWGIFAISFVYLALWIMGFYNHWIRRASYV